MQLCFEADICQCKHWQMGLMRTCAGDMSHRRKVGAVVRTGADAARARLPPIAPRRSPGKSVSPSGCACTSVISSRSAKAHPLRVDFRAADHGDFSDRTPQRIAVATARAASSEVVTTAPAARKSASRVTTMLVRSGQRPAQRGEGLAAHHDRLAHRHRLEALHVALQPPGDRAAGADHAVVGDRDDEHDLHHGAAFLALQALPARAPSRPGTASTRPS